MKFYAELAPWWPLISPVAHYEQEALWFLEQVRSWTERGDATLLELGSGGGNNAWFMKRPFASTTLVDLSADMQVVSRALNPDCEHRLGDMRSVRLERTFDVVFIHDAIGYMSTQDDLQRAIQSAAIHCKPGGVVMLVPDHVSETYAPGTETGGEDGDGRGIRYLEWSHAAGASSYETDYVFILRDGAKAPEIHHDRHTFGLFPLQTWIDLLQECGLAASARIDEYDRYVLFGYKAR